MVEKEVTETEESDKIDEELEAGLEADGKGDGENEPKSIYR